MTHFGLLCPTATGHLNPMITLGCELQRRGHRVTVFQVADAEAIVRASGLGFCQLGATTFPLGRMAEITARLGELKGLTAVRYSVDWIRQTTQLFLDESPEAIRSEGIEALIIDQIVIEGETIAQRLNLPFVSFCSALPINREITIPPIITNWTYSTAGWAIVRNRLGYALLDRLTRSVIDLIQVYRQRWGLPLYQVGDYPFSKQLQLSQQLAEFEYPRPNLHPNFHFTGPIHDSRSRAAAPFPYDRLTGQPLIYASMGTLQNRQQWIFEAIAQACESLPVQLVISLGNRKTEIVPTFPGSPIVVPYAPQLELLQRAALTITHAGLNTTLESLACGVPMVAIPITNDQPGVAARIDWAGVGKVVAPDRLTLPRLRSAIQQVLTQDSYRQNAQRLQSAIQRSGGVKLAADLVEQVIESTVPDRSQISKS